MIKREFQGRGFAADILEIQSARIISGSIDDDDDNYYFKDILYLFM
jgi:hypothetical protein